MPITLTISILILSFFVFANLLLALIRLFFRFKKLEWQKLTALIILLAAMPAYLLLFQLTGIMINTTPSLPIGIYVKSGSQNLEKGDVAAFCLDNQTYIRIAKERGYLGAGGCHSGLKPLLKQVGGLPGDVIDFEQDGSISVNGEIIADSRIAKVDLNGRELPETSLVPGAIPNGKVFVVSRHSGGFDSRYFGLVEINKLIKYQPLITFGKENN